jgi:hypothetical protein
LIQRRHRSVLSKQHPIVARHQLLGDRDNLLVDVHFSVIPSDERDNKVLIMFEPNGPGKEPKRSNRPHDGNSRSGKRK